RISDTNPSVAFGNNLGAERALEVAPASAQQASEVMEFAVRENLAVNPAGAGTLLDVGNSTTGAALVLTARRMKTIVRHEPADHVATAEAGVTLVNFHKHLAQSCQWLPIDPPDDGRATLGGVIASGLSGPQTLGFGLPRSFVIGMRAVLADGRQIKAGGNVVKNVAGYDLCKLFTGSYGTLGLMTELTFKLRPLPEETRTVVACGPVGSLIVAGRKIATKFFPVAVEIISERLASELKIEAKRSEGALLIRFAGSSRGVISQTAQALKLLREDVNNRCETFAEDETLWGKLSAAPLQFSEQISWRVKLRPTDLVSFINETAELEKDEASHVSLRWHAGVGDGRLRAMARAPVYHREAVRALERLRRKAENLGGSLVMESAPMEIKREFDAWGDFGSTAELMKRVKLQLDPQNLWSPGRFKRPLI